jgi:hypothetical protein
VVGHRKRNAGICGCNREAIGTATKESYVAGSKRQKGDGPGYQTLLGSALRVGAGVFELASPMMALAQPGGQSGPLHTRRCQDLPAGLREPGARIATNKLKNETPSIVKNNCLEVISFPRQKEQ